MKTIVIMLALAACTGDDAKPVPQCADVGCGSAALCNRRGECTCPQPDGHSVACTFFHPDAGP